MFEKEILLGYGQHSLSLYPHSWRDLPRSSKDEDVSYEHRRRKETQKYLRKSCYHCIKCTVTTFLAAFMWRRHINSVVLATTTHKKPGEVSNRTGTQVVSQTVDKCRVKMIQRELYNVKKSSMRKGLGKFQRIDCSNLIYNCTKS